MYPTLDGPKFYNEVTLCELQVLGLLGKHLTGPWKTKFYNEVTLCELQVLGLLGKHLTGPWKTKFYNEVTLCELQVLGLLGKHLTGPWKTKFYTPADTVISHADGINIVKQLVEDSHEASSVMMMQNSVMIRSFLDSSACEDSAYSTT